MKLDLKKWNGLIYSQTTLAQEVTPSSSEYRCWVCIENTKSWTLPSPYGPHPFIHETDALFSVVKLEVTAWDMERGDGITGIFNAEYEDATDEDALYEILNRKGYRIDLFVESWNADYPW
jgi:hypothetical protein